MSRSIRALAEARRRGGSVHGAGERRRFDSRLRLGRRLLPSAVSATKYAVMLLTTGMLVMAVEPARALATSAHAAHTTNSLKRTRVRRSRWCWCTEAAMQAARTRCVSARCSVAWTAPDTRPVQSTGAMDRGPSRRWTCSRALTVCALTVSPVRSRSRPCVRDRTCCPQERVTQALGLARSVRCSVGCAATGTRQDRSTVDTDRGRSGR